MPNSTASIHKQPGKPSWFCAFTTPDGQRHFNSTGTPDKRQAAEICRAWAKASLHGEQLNADKAREIIAAGTAAYFAVQLTCSGRRSTHTSTTDVMQPGTQLKRTMTKNESWRRVWPTGKTPVLPQSTWAGWPGAKWSVRNAGAEAGGHNAVRLWSHHPASYHYLQAVANEQFMRLNPKFYGARIRRESPNFECCKQAMTL